MSKKKSSSFFRNSVFVGIALAVLGTVGLVNLASRKETVIEFPEASTPVVYSNPVRNPSFEIDANNDKYPDNWTKVGNVTRRDGITQEESYDGQNSLKLTLGKTKFFRQTVTGNWPRGTRFDIQAFSKAVGFADQDHIGEIRLKFIHQNRTSDPDQIMYITTNPGDHDWEENSHPWTATLLSPVTSVVVELGTTASKKGTLYYDKVSILATTPTPTPTRASTPTPTRGSTPTVMPSIMPCVYCRPVSGCTYPNQTCTACGPMLCSPTITPAI